MHILIELCLTAKEQYSSTSLQSHPYLGELWAPLKYRSSAAAFRVSPLHKTQLSISVN